MKYPINKKLIMVFFISTLFILIFLNKIDDIYFSICYNKAKDYFGSSAKVKLTNSSDHIFKDMERVLILNPENKSALLNLSWYMLKFIGDSTKLNRCFQYIKKLKSLDPDNPLYLMLEFNFYDQIAFYYFAEGDFLFKFNFNQTALDTLPVLAKIYQDRFKTNHYVRLNILPYLEFENFKKREKFLIETLKIYENKKYKSKLINSLKQMHFIEADAKTERHIAYLDENSIKIFLEHFYNISFVEKLKAQYYKMNFNLNNRIPSIEKFPLKYKNFLKNLDKY